MSDIRADISEYKESMKEITTYEPYQKLKPTSKRYTYCKTHKENYHDPRDCWFTLGGKMQKIYH